MRVENLKTEDLLEINPEGGLIHFSGQREILIDTVAMGILRKYLVENFGAIAARTILPQFGFAHGWRLAESLSNQFEWDTADDRQHASSRLFSLQGLFNLDPRSNGPLTESGVVFADSYEAEQHLAHFGRADEPVCWTICGLFSGFLSQTEGKEVFVLEDRCVGSGGATCHLFGRTREQWGDEHAEELRFYEPNRLADCLDVSLQRVIESLKDAERKLRRHRRVLERAVPEVAEPTGMVAKSAAMRKVVDMARRVAKVDSTVLITGESGTGKERIARLVHEESTRADGPFIAVNCGAVTETILESELFGHVRGAFTGASQDRPGLFEAANHGTLLLDEIGDVSQNMQVKLLRVLQEREVRRVGENKSRSVDVRILAATNRDLTHGVASGVFREDLYYRLRVVEIRVPPLRDRRDDILPLARVLLASTALWMKREISGISPAAADRLLRHEWPGNVRELENAMERAVALAPGGRVEIDDLPDDIRNAGLLPTSTVGPVRPLEEIEKEYILAALEVNHGNQTHTAKQLGIGQATLYRKLKKYGYSAE